MKILSLLISFFLFQNAAFAVDLSRNLIFQSSKKEQDANEARRGHLGRSFLPELSLTIGDEYLDVEDVPSKTQPYGYLEGKVNLYRAGKDQLKSEIIELQSSIGIAKSNLIQRELQKKIRRALIEITFNKELLSILSKEKQKNLSVKDQASQKANSGLTTSTDILEFSIYDSEIEEKMRNLEFHIDALESKLTLLYGTDDSPIEYSSKFEINQKQNFAQKKLNYDEHPEILTYTLENRVFEKQRMIASNYWLPSVDLYAGHYKNFEVFNRDYQERTQSDAQIIGVRVSFDLYDGGKSRTSSTSSLYLAESKKLMARYVKEEAELEFNRLKDELHFTSKSINSISSRLAKASEYLNVVIREYRKGVKNSLDALSALQRYYGFEKDLLKKKRDYEVIKIEIQALLGE